MKVKKIASSPLYTQSRTYQKNMYKILRAIKISIYRIIDKSQSSTSLFTKYNVSFNYMAHQNNNTTLQYKSEHIGTKTCSNINENRKKSHEGQRT